MLTIRGRSLSSGLFLSAHTGAPSGLPLSAEFLSLYEPLEPPTAAGSEPGYNNPQALSKLPPLPSQSVVTSVLGGSLLLGGVDFSPYIVASDILSPAHGELQGTIRLVANHPAVIDPSQLPQLQPGQSVSYHLNVAGLTLPLVVNGYIVEPPKFKRKRDSLFECEIRVGDIFLLKRQSENILIEPYCGPLPRSVADAASIFSRLRGIGGDWGGGSLVEGLAPDFIDGPPWDFLSSLYEGLDFDVRTSPNGTPGAFPRLSPLNARAITLEPWQCIEADLDSPESLPFSSITAYNTFDRDLGFRQSQQEIRDNSRFDPTDTRPWFESNSTYQIIRTTSLGDTDFLTETETWGYLPTVTTIPPQNRQTEGPCGEPLPPAQQPPTELARISQTIERLNFEPHVSGNFLVNSRESQTRGWGIWEDTEGNTRLYFGTLASEREVYQHTPIEVEGVCPQYWQIVRVATQKQIFGRVDGENSEPSYQITQRESETWQQLSETLTEGAAFQWSQSGTSETWDSEKSRWVGGSLGGSVENSPPSAIFVRSFKVPVTLEATVRGEEFVRLFGERTSKPISFPLAFTTQDLVTAANRYLRDSVGLAYAIHLVVDPRVPLNPGQPVLYRRGSELIHAAVDSREFNLSGTTLTQSVILRRTFTEPANVSIRLNPSFDPSQLNTFSEGDPCFV